MGKLPHTTFSVEILEEEVEWTQSELCQACEISADQLADFVEEGLVDPDGQGPAEWHFHGTSLHRIRFARSVKRDLGVNTAGAALALDLLEEIEKLKQRLRRLGP
jgi:chaperone modulatory protein CbpM